MAKKLKLKLPKTIGACIDLWYEKRQERLALGRAIDHIKEEEALIREHLLKEVPKQDLNGIKGKRGQLSLDKKRFPRVFDWDDLMKHIRKTGEFDLLQRRVNEGACQERWEAKRKIPGVMPEEIIVPSVHKVGSKS